MKLEPVAWMYQERKGKPFASTVPPESQDPIQLSENEVTVTDLYAIPEGYVVVPVSKLGALELENKMLEAANEAAGKIESLLRQRLQDVRMYLLAEADKHTPRDPILGEAYQMTQRHLEWCPAAAKEQS